MKKFVQTLYNYRYTITKANSHNEEPEEEIWFSVEEGNMNEKSTTKNRSPIISSSEDEDFPTSTKKRKRLIKISDDSVRYQIQETRDANSNVK